LSEPRQVEAYGVKGHEKQKRLSSTSEQPPFFAVLSSNTHDKIEDIPSKAQALEQLSERIASLNTDEETLDYFEKLTESCRHLSEGSEFKLAERILWTYLPGIEAIAKLSFQNHARVASIVSQSYLLAASLAGQHNNLMKRLQFSENALLYGKVANDRNLQIAAMKQLATTLDLQGHTNEVLQAYQQTIPFLNEISPLLQSLIYSGISGTYAQLKQRQEAIRYLALAYESFPADPEKDLSFSFANGSYCALIFCDGLTHLDFHEPHKAEQIFAQIDGLHPKIQIAKKVRIDLLNCQVATYIELNEMEQACIYLEEAANVAIIIGSERRFQESFTLLQQMQKVWPHELRIKQLEALFRS
ncbi:MAG TPA: hypothetical protein VKU38_04095, partial [Ktedonobacteraceae bacterium]|nr:hypothetical protein [Ktedonobacteraceae bacterium]